eukprot:scaffold15618_cov60-Phaeocystis_antarctica.AAC.2
MCTTCLCGSCSLTRVASDGPSTATASYAVSAWRLCRSSETKWLGNHEMANGENISSTKTPVQGKAQACE